MLGPTEVVADRSWPHGESVVLELRCAGTRVIGKAYRQREKFLNERWVYERWVPTGVLGADEIDDDGEPWAKVEHACAR